MKNQQPPASTTPITYDQALAHARADMPASSAVQMATATNRFLEALGKSLESLIGPEFLESYEQSLQVLYHDLKAKGRADATYSSVASRIGTLRTAALVLIADQSLPPIFSAALAAAIDRSPYSYADVDLKFGGVVQRWRLNSNLPSVNSLPKVRALEEFLGIPGCLVSRLPHLIRHSSVVVEIDPSDNLPKEFGECLRELRKRNGLRIRELIRRIIAAGVSFKSGSISRWELKVANPLKVKRIVVEAIEVVLGVSGPLLNRYDRLVAANSPYSPTSLSAKGYGYWSDNLNREFEHLAWFKSTSDLPENLKRNKEGIWARPASKKMYHINLRLFFGYCRLPANSVDPMLSGAGIPTTDLGLALLLKYSLIRGFCDFRKGRNARQAYNASTITFIAAIRNLVHPLTGYFTQFPDRFCEHPRIRELLPSEIKVNVLGKEETRLLPHPHQRFVAHCCEIYSKTNEFLRALTKDGLAVQTRDPAWRIKQILTQEQPLESFLVLRERMETALPRMRARQKIAMQLTNIALVALMNVKPLRVSTLATIRESEIFRDSRNGSWQAAVPKERFKNEKFGGRSGWFGEIHNSAWAALDAYWDQGRPFLLFSKKCDLFWVNSDGGAFLNGSLFGRFLAFTKDYIPDFAPEGVNPHAWRKVISNDNFKTDRLNAVTKSAQQLNDLPKTVMKSYAMDTDQLRNDWVNGHTDARFKKRKS